MVLKLFQKIASIPHCSGGTKRFASFIISFAKKCGYLVKQDRAGNILCYRSKREIALQAHYDMVCVGRAPKIETFIENGYLMAQKSSLGADNGIGVAMMLALMQEGKEAEFLFTNDEEIGLVGAKNLELELKAKKMLNLDSEEFGAIYVGCAGGVDLFATKEVDFEKKDGNFYHIEAKNFPGGHSGVDIDKDIPNAIKAFAHFVGSKAKIASLKTENRLNAIPTKVEAVVCTPYKLTSNEHFDVKPALEKEVCKEELTKMLCGFADGLRGWEQEFGIPKRSCNLATVTLDKRVEIGCSLRGNSDSDLKKIEDEVGCFFKNFGYNVVTKDRYPAWKPKITPFAKEVQKRYQKYSPNPTFKAIHAGLEAAVFAQKFPNMEIVSIGPTIENPHSIYERLKIDTVEPLYELLKEFL